MVGSSVKPQKVSQYEITQRKKCLTNCFSQLYKKKTFLGVPKSGKLFLTMQTLYLVRVMKQICTLNTHFCNLVNPDIMLTIHFVVVVVLFSFAVL